MISVVFMSPCKETPESWKSPYESVGVKKFRASLYGGPLGTPGTYGMGLMQDHEGSLLEITVIFLSNS